MFTVEDIRLIRWTVRRFGTLSRTEPPRTLCENLPWKAPNGQLKVAACVGPLERLAAAGVVTLPARRGTAPERSTERMGTVPPSPVVRAALAAIQPVRVEPVLEDDRPPWNAMMATHHPPGFRRAFGAQQKYWVQDEATGRARVLGGAAVRGGGEDGRTATAGPGACAGGDGEIGLGVPAGTGLARPPYGTAGGGDRWRVGYLDTSVSGPCGPVPASSVR